MMTGLAYPPAKEGRPSCAEYKDRPHLMMTYLAPAKLAHMLERDPLQLKSNTTTQTWPT